MSDLLSKLETPERKPGTRAQATLEQLLKRWGSPRDINAKKPPTLIIVRQLDGAREWWKRMGSTDTYQMLPEEEGEP